MRLRWLERKLDPDSDWGLPEGRGGSGGPSNGMGVTGSHSFNTAPSVVPRWRSGGQSDASRVVGVRASPQGKWKFPAKFTGTKGDAIYSQQSQRLSLTLSREDTDEAGSPAHGPSYGPVGEGEEGEGCPLAPAHPGPQGAPEGQILET